MRCFTRASVYEVSGVSPVSSVSGPGSVIKCFPSGLVSSRKARLAFLVLEDLTGVKTEERESDDIDDSLRDAGTEENKRCDRVPNESGGIFFQGEEIERHQTNSVRPR